MGEISDLPTMIRSMQTAGVNSARVVVADFAAADLIRTSISHVIESCGVVLVDVGSLMAHQLKGRYRTRWHWVCDHFRLNPLEFEEFTMTDAYDSSVQGDIFLSSVRDDSQFSNVQTIQDGFKRRSQKQSRNPDTYQSSAQDQSLVELNHCCVCVKLCSRCLNGVRIGISHLIRHVSMESCGWGISKREDFHMK
jgi:hypothetical protein